MLFVMHSVLGWEVCSHEQGVVFWFIFDRLEMIIFFVWKTAWYKNSLSIYLEFSQNETKTLISLNWLHFEDKTENFYKINCISGS